MRTSIGDFLRKLRLERGEKLKDMADTLGVTSAFLSAVENGRKNMPSPWITIIKREYSLSAEQVEQMKQNAMESQNSISLNIKNIPSLNKELAVSFARQFDEMDEETSKQILNVLKKRKRGDENG